MCALQRMCCGVLQVGPRGKVIGIDHIKELVEDSVTNVKKDDPSLISSGRIRLIGWSTTLFLAVLHDVLYNVLTF